MDNQVIKVSEVEAVVAMQRFEGSWDLSDNLCKEICIEKSKILDTLNKFGDEENSGMVTLWTTIIVLSWLKKNATEEDNIILELLIEKAKLYAEMKSIEVILKLFEIF